MTTEWIITTVSLSLTALMSLSSLIMPPIMNYKNNKLKFNEHEFEIFHQTIDDLMTGYGEFKSNSYHTVHVLSAIYKVMAYSSETTKKKFQQLCFLILSKSAHQQTDEIFYECIQLLQTEFKFTKRIGK